MSTPLHNVDVPERVRELADGAPLTPVWENGIGGLTFRTSDRYIKYGPRNTETSMAAEAERLAWAGRFFEVPHVLTQGSDDTHEWLVTRALPGRSAVDPMWINRPEEAVTATGRALRALHDALPVGSCPFAWSVESRVANAAERGITVPAQFRSAPPIDRLVVCHGDACVPNTLIGDDGTWVGVSDLGALGVADRWADIAVASMSTEWNYGPGYEDLLIEAYGITPDRERMHFYRELWNNT